MGSLEDRAYETDIDEPMPSPEERKRSEKVSELCRKINEEDKRRKKLHWDELDILSKLLRGEPPIDYRDNYKFNKSYEDEKDLYNFLIKACIKRPDEWVEDAADRLLWIYHSEPNKNSVRTEHAREILLFTKSQRYGREYYPGREELWKLYHESFGTGLGRTAGKLLENYETKTGLVETELKAGAAAALIGGITTLLITNSESFYQSAAADFLDCHNFLDSIAYTFLGIGIGAGAGVLIGKAAYRLFHRYYSNREAKRHGG